jgi:ribosome-binding protein aMBF1 (putative translation factor)
MTKMEVERRRREWSQADLAELADLSQPDISAFENGWRKPYPSQALRLAKALRLKASELTEDASVA